LDGSYSKQAAVRIIYEILVGKPQGKLLVSSRIRWEGNIKMNLEQK